MSDAHSATPARRQLTARFRDTRLIAGMFLILVSMLATYALLSNAKHEDEYYVAARALVPGQEITADDVRAVNAHLGSQHEQYVLTAQDFVGGFTTSSIIAEGQFIGVDNLVPLDSVERKTIGLPVEKSATHGLTRGDYVEVWHLPKVRTSALSEDTAAPDLLTSHAIISDITDNGGGLLSVSSTTVYIDVAGEDVVTLLTALASDGDFALLTVGAAQS